MSIFFSKIKNHQKAVYLSSILVLLVLDIQLFIITSYADTSLNHFIGIVLYVLTFGVFINTIIKLIQRFQLTKISLNAKIISLGLSGVVLFQNIGHINILATILLMILVLYGYKLLSRKSTMEADYQPSALNNIRSIN